MLYLQKKIVAERHWTDSHAHPFGAATRPTNQQKKTNSSNPIL
jgi:hypothetical protein